MYRLAYNQCESMLHQWYSYYFSQDVGGFNHEGTSRDLLAPEPTISTLGAKNNEIMIEIAAISYWYSDCVGPAHFGAERQQASIVVLFIVVNTIHAHFLADYPLRYLTHL